MDSNLLKVFVAVVQQKSITLGAEVLGFTQSNVTLRIKQLEKTLGYELFYRLAKGVVLTKEGEKLYPLSLEIVRKVEEATLKMKNISHQTLLRIGTSQANATIRLLPLIEKLQIDFPGMEFELHTGNTPDITEKLLEYKVDIAFIPGDPKHKDIIILNQFDDDLCMVETKKKLITNTLLGYRAKSTHLYFFQEYHKRQCNLEFKTMILENYEVMLGCIKAGIGKALISKKIVEKFGYSEYLKVTKLPESVCDMNTRLVCRKDHVPLISDYLKRLQLD